MKLYEYQVSVVELELADGGWTRRKHLAEYLRSGWVITGTAAPTRQNVLVVLQKRFWFWQSRHTPRLKRDAARSAPGNLADLSMPIPNQK
jgi:hypothetical protein